MAHKVCSGCGVRDDAFGCYETCTFNGPLHVWADPPKKRSAVEKWPAQPRPGPPPSEDMKIANRMANYGTK